MTQAQKFAETYTQAFIDSYPDLKADLAHIAIARVTETACKNIRSVLIDGKAFKLTAKRLGINCTYKAFEEFLAR